MLGSASTAARVPTTAQTSRPSREDVAALSHMMDCMDNTKEKKRPLALGRRSANRGWKKFRIRERTSESSRCTPLLQWTDCTESSPRSLGVTFFPCSLTSLPNIRSHYYTTSSQNLSTMACIKRSSSLARKPTARSGPLS
jgi:hypothetical protein